MNWVCIGLGLCNKLGSSLFLWLGIDTGVLNIDLLSGNFKSLEKVLARRLI